MSPDLELVTIDNAVPNETYYLYIPENVGKTIPVTVDDGHGSHMEIYLDRGFYKAKCVHDTHAVGEPKYWSVYVPKARMPTVEVDNREIKGATVLSTLNYSKFL